MQANAQAATKASSHSILHRPVCMPALQKQLQGSSAKLARQHSIGGSCHLSGLAAQVHWHRSLDEVPDDRPTVYIAHEFFDALPVHQFQKTERGWLERLVDVASDDSPLHLRLVLAPRPTPASKLLVDRRLNALPFDQSKACCCICSRAPGT